MSERDPKSGVPLWIARHGPLGIKLFKFFIFGIPAFLIAIPLNIALVKWAGLGKPGAYAIVLAVQVVINFFACRWFVFERDPGVGLWRSFAWFLNGILVFRVLDWGVYSLLTAKFHLPFIGVQLFNVGLFGLLKFEFSRRIFERRKPGRPDSRGGRSGDA